MATHVSYYLDSQAEAIDAFTISWSFNLCYIFAPFSIMGQVLKKLQEDQGEAVVICPLWATQPWFPLILGMIVENSYILPQTSKLLYLPQDPDRQHPLRKMRLDAFRLSGKALASSGIHGQTADIILDSWMPSTTKQYRCYIKKWLQFSNTRQIDPFNPPINSVLEFLTELFYQGLVTVLSMWHIQPYLQCWLFKGMILFVKIN